ncbi:hypothetical protein GN958_ATG03429 [Phytophthora infestans]|uniref:Uncharacterized protein n=1 Tax=Phytophthora infestans TaxID=4787 RepID=A0A8S9V870_PHYIN|nr:hypothetical protein GN958_ATG03429 [Phytophthora infestans]
MNCNMSYGPWTLDGNGRTCEDEWWQLVRPVVARTTRVADVSRRVLTDGLKRSTNESMVLECTTNGSNVMEWTMIATKRLVWTMSDTYETAETLNGEQGLVRMVNGEHELVRTLNGRL